MYRRPSNDLTPPGHEPSGRRRPSAEAVFEAGETRDRSGTWGPVNEDVPKLTTRAQEWYAAVVETDGALFSSKLACRCIKVAIRHVRTRRWLLSRLSCVRKRGELKDPNSQSLKRTSHSTLGSFHVPARRRRYATLVPKDETKRDPLHTVEDQLGGHKGRTGKRPPRVERARMCN